MTLHQQDYFSRHGMQENRSISNLPTTTDSSEEEAMTDSDEPPDEQYGNTPRATSRLPPIETSDFSKMSRTTLERKESLLTQALHTSPTESNSKTRSSQYAEFSRGGSTTSTYSNASTAELTSGATSPDTQTSSPSPPLPPSAFHGLPPIFNKSVFDQPVSVRHHDENVGPLQKTSDDSAESTIEAGLGRKRCITFACGRKEVSKMITVAEPPKPSEKPAEAPKRACTIKFACPNKVSSEAPSSGKKPRMRVVSPAPVRKLPLSPKPTPKAHRGSDSTVRNESPKATRKSPAYKMRKYSSNSDLGRSEATRFSEFRSSGEDDDEWVQESTCYRNRLTVTDTLRVENRLRRLAEEAEEEAIEDEEDEDEEDEDEDEDLEDEDEDEDIDADEEDEDKAVHSSGYASDDGFQTDDEGGFAGSDSDSDVGSDYQWWAPGRSTAATSTDQLEHIRPTGRRSISDSSIGSDGSGSEAVREAVKQIKRRRSRALNIRPRSPELPDSTDFVCGTLDEDRPLEEAYMSQLEARRAAKHKVTPQDIDPTFPTSDPEMDEEDEVDDENHIVEEESDQHLLMHGQLDPHDGGEQRGRSGGVPKKRSPIQSPKRLRSPPPAKRTAVHRSPPPRRLFGPSPPKRLRSPPPAARLRSPPPTRRTSWIASPKPQGAGIRFAGLAERPQPTVAASLPRGLTILTAEDQEHEDDDIQENLIRGAIDIRMGLEKKRQRRRERLHQKHCRKACKDKERRPQPGKGAERMREMGLELAAYKGKGAAAFTKNEDVLMLSY